MARDKNNFYSDPDKDALIETLKTELEFARARIAMLEVSAKAETPAIVLEKKPYLLVTLKHDGISHAPGALMPFDPENPPAGCDGLKQGVHYEYAR